MIIPWTEDSFLPFRPRADLWMWLSAIPMGGQAICMSMAIGLYQVPTEANIFYAGRGFWSVVLVAILGGYLGLKEGKSSITVFIEKNVGSISSSNRSLAYIQLVCR